MLPNLKALRMRRGMSQQQLASVIQVSQQSINKYENHDVEPNIETLCAIADLFEVSVDYLIGRTDIERKIESTSFCELNQNEMKLIENWRSLCPNDKETLFHLSSRLQK